MNRQRGVSLSGLLFWAFILVIVALLGMKVAPSAIEYSKILKDIKAVAQDSSLKDKTLGEIRTAFSKRAEIDEIHVISAQDLEITKENGELVVSFAYEHRIPLFANVSLVIAYEGTTAK